MINSETDVRIIARLNPFAFGRTRSDPALLLLQARATSILHPISDAFGLSARQCRDVIAWHEARRDERWPRQKQSWKPHVTHLMRPSASSTATAWHGGGHE